MMELKDYSGQAVIVSGGTRGIGLAIGLKFAQSGAHVFLTHRWGSADENDIKRLFDSVGALTPTIIEADASIEEENEALINQIVQQGLTISIFVSCVCVVTQGTGLDGSSKRTYQRCLDYSAWPFSNIIEMIRKYTGSYPKYSIAISSDGHLSYYPGYDYVASSKAVLESISRSLAQRLRPHHCYTNIIRTRSVLTESYYEIFSEQNRALVEPFKNFTLLPDNIANVAYALCSGYMDNVNGEVIVVDKAANMLDNLMSMGGQLVDNLHA